MTTSPRHKLPDPQGMIARIRARLNPKCMVRQSPFCDTIISMRMQGLHFIEIEKWLISQGDQFRIAAPTIHRNLQDTQMEVKLTYAEEMLENMGGAVKLDLIREMSSLIVTEKERVDRLVRKEIATQQERGDPGYTDKRLGFEMERLSNMMRQLHDVLAEVPAKAKEAAEAEDQRAALLGMHMTKDAESLIRDMVLNDELVLGPEALIAATKH